MKMAMHYIYCHFRLKVLLNLANRKKGACGAPERKQKSSTDILMMAAPQVVNKKKEKDRLKVLLNLANRKKGACGAPERKQKSSTDILMMAAPQVANKKKEKEKKALGAAKNVQWLPTANIQLWILTHRIT
jgi:hypothetical protein